MNRVCVGRDLKTRQAKRDSVPGTSTQWLFHSMFLLRQLGEGGSLALIPWTACVCDDIIVEYDYAYSLLHFDEIMI